MANDAPSSATHQVARSSDTTSQEAEVTYPKIADLMDILEASVSAARSSAHNTSQVLRFGRFAGLTVAEMNATLHENCAQWPNCTSCDGSAPEIEDIHCAESGAQNHDRLWIVSGSTGADHYFASHSEDVAKAHFASLITKGFSADLYRVKPKAMRKVLRNPSLNDRPLIVGSIVDGASEAADLLFSLCERGKEVITINQ